VASHSTVIIDRHVDREKQAQRPISVSVEWGYDLHHCPMSRRTWSRIVAGKAVLRKEPYWYEGERYTGEWHFNHRGRGTLLVTYDDGGVGFDGVLAEAYVYIDGKQVNWRDVAAP
jgi:hypothetical protein